MELVLYLIAAALYIAYLVYICLPILGLAFAGYGAIGVVYTIGRHGSGLARQASVASRSVSPDEPARYGYWHKMVYEDYRAAMAYAAAGLDEINKPIKSAMAAEFDMFTGPVVKAFGIGGGAGLYIGFVLGSVYASAINLAIAVTGTITVNVSMILLRIGQWLWGTALKIRHPCPKCYSKGEPVFACPTCGAEHSDLRPNGYGTLVHTCVCGTNLPTVALLGRRALPARCRACGEALRETETTDIHLAFAGGPSSGKSTLMLSVLGSMLQKGYSIDFIDSAQEDSVRREIERLSQGSTVLKTQETLPKALHLLFKGGGLVDKSLYIYDVAGEAFLSAEDPLRQRYYDHVDGVIFVVDPLSVESYAERHQDKLDDRERSARSHLAPQEAYGRLIRALYTHLGGNKKAVRRARIAVALSKADLPGLSADIDGMLSDSEKPVKRSDKVRQWLIEHGEGNLVHLIEGDFARVNYFEVSALGRSAFSGGSGPFVGRGLMAPIAWALPSLRVGGDSDG